MNRTVRLLAVAGVVCWLAAGAARGDIANGDFSSGLDDWSAFAYPPGHAVAEPVASQLHVRTENTWVWNDVLEEWEIEKDDLSFAYVQQLVPSDGGGLYAPAGTTGLEFAYYEASLADAPGNTAAGVTVSVTYNGDANYEEVKLTNGSGTGLIDLPGLVTDEYIYIEIRVSSDLSPFPDETVPDRYEIVAEASLDDITFIPEPGTLAALLVGGLAGLTRRKRRRQIARGRQHNAG